ncbi:MAG: EamA family transporter [Chitinivibrionales bacterium]|nr:EamA family transporter [Chitinivibrionales bacterium]
MDQKRFGAYLCILTAVIIWGISFVATKIALETIPLYLLIFTRFGIALFFFLVYKAIRREWIAFSRREHGSVFLLALFQPGLYFFCETTGLQSTSAPIASLLIATIPIAVLLLSLIIYKEKITLLKKIGTAISLCGIALLIFGAPNASFSLAGSFKGDLYIIGAVISAAFYTVLLRRFVQTNSALDLTFMQSVYGVLFYIPFALPSMLSNNLAAITRSSVIAVLFLAILSTLVAFLCFNYGLKYVTAVQSSLFSNCVPIVTIIVSAFLIHERLSLIQFCGAALVLAAVALSSQSRDESQISKATMALTQQTEQLNLENEIKTV